MRHILFGLFALVLAVMLTGCVSGQGGTPNRSSSLSQVEENTEQAGSADDATEQNQTAQEQEFKNLVLQIEEGALYLRTGETFSLARQDGGTLAYEIQEGVLYVENSQPGEIVLTLPQGDDYDNLQLMVKNGHVYADAPLTFGGLHVRLEQGETTLKQLTVTGGSNLQVQKGSLSVSGTLGDTLQAACQEGHMYLAVPIPADSCNYSVDVTEGDIAVGGTHYAGRSVTQTVNNGGSCDFSLSCARGQLSVVFSG